MYLVFFQAVLLHHLVPLLLKGDDDQGHKDVDEEEGEHYKVHHVEDGHLHAVPGAGALVLESGIHRVLEDPAMCGKERGEGVGRAGHGVGGTRGDGKETSAVNAF